jgi:hypothetical protein
MFNIVIAALLELSFFALAEAAPMSVQSAKPWQAGTGGGIVGFIVLVLDIIAWSKFPHDVAAPFFSEGAVMLVEN